MNTLECKVKETTAIHFLEVSKMIEANDYSKYSEIKQKYLEDMIVIVPEIELVHLEPVFKAWDKDIKSYSDLIAFVDKKREELV